ncbi:Sec-independent protein translocase protein TatB [Paracoccus sp. DMF-8]|uniref:Sec-independent protein translocase protein TatB n=1 Tax=Paracoccus sp. DMF-8 TaxID=3019445 RepID=UPI0023E77D2A|nr:Sec-independent protein translocase protein TatB [Paracoccus sp. DMF-8]MDF3605915.1 Sec-independent protein translocase protein TatB [Paracoccus sp. DMF-8]
MFDIGWSELLLIGVVALIVIGPEDLPKLFRTLGRISGRARSMAREFSNAMDDAARSSGPDEASKTLKDVGNLTSKRSLGLDALDRAADRFEKWDPLNPQDKKTATGLQRDPDAPAPVPAKPVVADVPAPFPAAAPADVTPPAAEVTTPRRLHALRRSDSDPARDSAKDRKGD